MKGVTAIYQGRIVSKKNFRTFIFASDGSQKLVESWDEYQAHMQTGVWFSSLEDIKPKTRQRRSKKAEPLVIIEEDFIDDLDEPVIEKGLAFEVTDNFLPK